MAPVERDVRKISGWKDRLRKVIRIMSIDKGELAVRGFLAGALYPKKTLILVFLYGSVSCVVCRVC